MMFCIIFSIIVAVGPLLAAIIVERKIPESVSSLVYLLPPKHQYLWTVWIWVLGITVGIPTLSLLSESLKFLSFLMMSFMGFTGAIPLIYKEQRRWHNILGVAACISSQLCVLNINVWWLCIWIVFPFCYLFKTTNCTVFIAEVLCAIGLYGGLLTSYV